MSRVRVTMIPLKGHDRPVWFVFESSHADMSALAADLRANGIVCGTRIDVESVRMGQKRERRRYPIVLAKNEFLLIEKANFELLPPEGVRG